MLHVTPILPGAGAVQKYRGGGQAGNAAADEGPAGTVQIQAGGVCNQAQGRHQAGPRFQGAVPHNVRQHWGGPTGLKQGAGMVRLQHVWAAAAQVVHSTNLGGTITPSATPACACLLPSATLLQMHPASNAAETAQLTQHMRLGTGMPRCGCSCAVRRKCQQSFYTACSQLLQMMMMQQHCSF